MAPKSLLVAAALSAVLGASNPFVPGARAATPDSGGAIPPASPNEERGVRPEEAPARPSEGSGSSSGNLSDQLSRSGGVIQPQGDVDPNIHRPAPDPGPQSTPVIPPPGSPGGNLDVKPK